MSNYNNLKTAIQQVIKQNGKQEITGDILQNTLLAMVNSIGENYQYVGIATPELDPGSPDQNVMYITSQNGVYANFNNLQVENEIAVLTFNGEWAKQTIYSLETVNDVQSRASQTYENLAAIEASGETNPNKIHIDGETMQPYIYKGGVFVPFSGVKPKGGYNRALFEAAGAVFNEDTGYYELYADEGGLTDITEEQMYDIYTQTAHLAAISGENYNLFSLTCRTNFKGRILGSFDGVNKIFAYGSSKLEVLFLDDLNHLFSKDGIIVASFVADDFYYCNSLKKVIGSIRIEKVTKDVTYSYNLNIQSVKISGLKVNFQFFSKDSVIDYESIKYLVDNAANTAAITITVHPTTYGYLTGTIQPTTQVGGTTEEWQAIVTTAADKQITFATTE